jgi:hypothetical protein
MPASCLSDSCHCATLGLLSEEYDPAAKRLLGIFPQTFSHIALVKTALARADKPCQQRSGNIALPEVAQ